MVKIRLERRGNKAAPRYRIVAINARSKKGARALSVLGIWHPKTKLLKIDKKLLDSWVNKGAQVSEPVAKLLSI